MPSSCQDDGQGRQRQPRLLLLLFAVTMRALLLSSYSLISTYYPQYIKKEPYNQKRPSELTGYVLSAFSPTFVLGSLIAGHYVLRSHGSKFCLVTGLFVAGAAWLIFAALEYVTEWRYFLAFSIVLRVAIGLGVASADVASFSLVAASYPEKIGVVAGLMELTWTLGNMIGPPFGGSLYDWMGFAMPAGVTGILLLLFSLVAIFLPTGNSSQPSHTSNQTVYVSTKQFFGQIFRLWPILSLASTYIYTIALAFPQATLSDFLHTKYNFSPKDVGVVLLVGTVPSILATPVVGRLCDIVHPRLFTPIGVIMAAAGGFFLVSFGHVIELQYLAQISIGFGGAFTYCPAYTDLNNELCKRLEKDKLDENTTGKLYSVFVIFGNLGRVTGSAAGGASVDYLGFGEATILWGIIGTSFGVVYLLIFALSRAC
ncbi:MFS-type transporter SLC18B1-like [Corticium candelabrum]|uniref:MFS-type transporter SLC18B1-like n=1 Tax=Corticium candelabrum TaxID=121492 RepID=UPI002E25DB5C|nr:MFS-type transporter SLC18B1-like [Corticium candelabrum]